MNLLEIPDTRDAVAQTRAIFERVAHVIPEVEWPVHAPYVAAINRLKRERNAVILAHNYQVPEIFHTVADIVGDSLGLAVEAAQTDADVIVVCGVHFMAETAKLVNPGKTVLVPDLRAGCSLADSITGADVRLLRERYPGVPVVTYVNTSAEVKAESDICVTSGNAVKIVESLRAQRVLFLPDEYLAQYVASQTGVEIIAWKGHCEVHERFTGDQIRAYREGDPGLIVLAHPECPPDVLAEADYVGSTQGMSSYVQRERPARVVMITECSMASNVSANFPDVEFVRPCNLCPHMKRNTLPKVLHSLQTMQHEVTIDPEIALRARTAVERMIQDFVTFERTGAPPRLLVEPIVRNALLEDIGRGGDLTTDAIVAPEARAKARIVARKPGVISGLDPARFAFELLDPQAQFLITIADGERARAGQAVAEISCTARALLTAERTALNFLCRLSGIATATRGLVDAVAGYPTQIVCTRKTTPGLRVLEKYAVRCGGGSNHRFGLDDAVLVKDNHLALAGSIRAAVERVRSRVGHMVKVEVEVDTLEQLREALETPIDAVLLDNMNPEQLAQAVHLVNGRVLTEASGTITAERIVAVAQSGVDLVSSGWITHSAPTLDLGLDVEL